MPPGVICPTAWVLAASECISLVDQSCIDADDIALVQDLVLAGDAMNYLVIYGNTEGCRITVIIQEIRDAAKAADQSSRPDWSSSQVEMPGRIASSSSL